MTIVALPFRELRYGIRHYRRTHRRVSTDETLLELIWQQHRRAEYALAVRLAAERGDTQAITQRASDSVAVFTGSLARVGESAREAVLAIREAVLAFQS